MSSNPGRWPAGAYIYDPGIGFDFASGISAYIGDKSFYVKSHDLGYRIARTESSKSFRPGGILSLGCSFTYGDEVEAGQTFTQYLADELHLPAYNYGVCSFSYTHALIKARQLKEKGILDKLRPKYVILGCWKGLPGRSLSPFPPIASRNFKLPAAHLIKENDKISIKPPLQIGNVFDLIEMYRKEGAEMTFNKFFRIFLKAPGIYITYVKSKPFLNGKGKGRNSKSGSDIANYEIYDFYFSGIKKIFDEYDAKIIVLYMPTSPNNRPDNQITMALNKHRDLIFANGSEAVKKHDVPASDYQAVHPQTKAHRAYALEIMEEDHGSGKKQGRSLSA
ncbi:MAG: hypothetical protein U5Q03_00565 [Bacteroidota bacterium]|nr:hypothetical protein [Bacteroidota bacterium]